ncbi:MAG: sulfotransferase family protein [Alphaproteobacteria bacterium]|nr:sulfotransferase family protein [Alphaproteobacteria bacterium]
MIISHELRCIFVAVPKTATHAIRFALREYMAPDDVEQVGLFLKKRSHYPGIRDKMHGHIGAADLRAAVGAEIWDDYFSFAFVRNPWDRFVSSFFFLLRNHPTMINDPFRFMPQFLENSQRRNRIQVQPQYDFLYDEEGTCLVDFVGRYETLQQDYDVICKTLDIASTKLERVNSSIHGDYRTYYTNELRAAVAETYKSDITAFDYKFDD